MGGGGEAFEKGFGSLISADVGFNGIGEGGNVCEVSDPIIFLVGDGEGDRLVMSCHCPDDGVHVFGDHVYVVISLRIILFVAKYRLADGNGAVDLRARRECGFEDLDSDAFNLVRRRVGKTREVFLDLVRRRAGCLLASTPFEG